ncbi:MAG TPA: hypothetical protein PLX89_00205 [Verrucomicrobiota bacterium]|nr:hypothetical protein [Verrucomicrobiales bacterium]HRI11399.1 hypothetical protein [Verrucomicrobiota bacterium]
MKVQILRVMLLAGALALGILGCSTTSPTQATESRLAASGFKVVPAATPAEMARLQALPPGKVSTVQRGGTTYYVFPDSTQKAMYVGRQAEYDAYQQRLEIEANAAADNAAAQQSLGEARMNNAADWSELQDTWGSVWTQ